MKQKSIRYCKVNDCQNEVTGKRRYCDFHKQNYFLDPVERICSSCQKKWIAKRINANRCVVKLCLSCASQKGVKSEKRKAYFARLREKICPTCNVWFSKIKGQSKYCSVECEPKKQRAIKIILPRVKVCADCSAVVLNGYLRCNPCSEKINAERREFQRLYRRNYRKRRRKLGLDDRGRHIKRARKFGVDYVAGITAKKIALRDRMTCQICGTKVIKPQGQSKPNEWTVGHIVALSVGGSHTWDNVQCECRSCNCSKGTSTSRGQALLFGEVSILISRRQ